MTDVHDDAKSMVAKVCDNAISMATNVCDNTVSMAMEVCDDEVSIVTNTTRNSEDNEDLSLFGLQMLENRRIIQMDVTDKTLSPVLPVQSPMWHSKVQEAPTLLGVENSDQDSVISESLLVQKHLNCAQHIDSRNISGSQMSQLLFDDTQSSDTQSEVLPEQSLKTDYHHFTGSTKSLTQYNYPNMNLQSRVSDTTYSQTEDIGNSSGNKDFRPCISQSSGDTDGQPTKEFHLCSGQNSKGTDDQMTKAIQFDVTWNLRVENGQPVNVASVSSGDNAKRPSSSITQSSRVQAKGTSPSITQNSGVQANGTLTNSTQSSGVVQEKGIVITDSAQRSGDQEKMASPRSTLNSGSIDVHKGSVFHPGKTGSSAKRVKDKCRKLDSDREQSMSGESPRKSQRINMQVVGEDRQKKQIFTSQRESESQSILSAYETSPVATEHEREEAIFRKIVKQQEYVDKQLRKSDLVDTNKLKQHMETLQSLLRKLSEQHKSERHRLTADVRARSKTKQDRLRYKSEIEQLGKRQRQLIQLVQRQKMLSLKLKDITHPNNDFEYPIITVSLPEESQHQESEMAGSSQITITPPETNETRRLDTQSSTSSPVTTESCSQSLLFGYANDASVRENIPKNSEVMSPRKNFNKNTLMDKNSTSLRPRHGCSPRTLEEMSNFNPINPRQEMSNSCLVTQWDQAQPITHIIARSAQVQPNAHVVERTAHLEERSVPIQPSICADGHSAGPVHLLQSSSCVEEGSSQLHNNRPEVSSQTGTSLQVYKLSALSKAGLDTQQFGGKETPKTVSPLVTRKQNEPPNLKAKDPLLKTVIFPSDRISTPCTKAVSGKSRLITSLPPAVVKPQLNSLTTITSSPLPSDRQTSLYDPTFKSPSVQNSTAVDVISPSTASCSDVFPVKSTEISRRIQQRRHLAESQRQQTAECEYSVQVTKHLNEPHTEHVEEAPVTSMFKGSEEHYNTQVQTKYPSLGTLIGRGILVPAKDCLVTESQNGRYVGSLMESGLIRGQGGEVFKTAVQWVSAVNDGMFVKKRQAYKEVFYQGRPLLSFVDPCYLPEIDLTKIVDEPVSTRAPDDEVMKSSDCVSKTQTFVLESLLQNCTVRIISDNEIVPSSDLPDNFWSADFSNVRLPISMQEQIDCW